MLLGITVDNANMAVRAKLLCVIQKSHVSHTASKIYNETTFCKMVSKDEGTFILWFKWVTTWMSLYWRKFFLKKGKFEKLSDADLKKGEEFIGTT